MRFLMQEPAAVAAAAGPPTPSVTTAARALDLNTRDLVDQIFDSASRQPAAARISCQCRGPELSLGMPGAAGLLGQGAEQSHCRTLFLVAAGHPLRGWLCGGQPVSCWNQALAQPPAEACQCQEQGY